MYVFLKRYWVVLVGAFISIFAASSPFFLWPNENPQINWSRSAVVLSAIAFPAIFAALYLTMIQLRKSTAKPKINAVFTENGTSEKAITVIKDLSYKEEFQHELELSAINNGNAISRFFQIEFLVPHIYRPRLSSFSQLRHGPLPPKFDVSEKFQKLSLYNDSDIVFFVKKPVKICTLIIGTFTDKYEQYPKNFIINYKVYGDWAETQEGKLKVIIKKQEVTPHATTG